MGDVTRINPNLGDGNSTVINQDLAGGTLINPAANQADPAATSINAALDQSLQIRTGTILCDGYVVDHNLRLVWETLHSEVWEFGGKVQSSNLDLPDASQGSEGRLPFPPNFGEGAVPVVGVHSPPRTGIHNGAGRCSPGRGGTHRRDHRVP